MADLSDVLDSLTSLVTTAVYPSGTSQPSVAGVDVTIMPGWPIRNVLDTQLIAGNAMVSIFPTNKERVVTKFERVFQPLTKTNPTLTAIVLNNTVTIGGTVTIPQAITVFANKVAYSYQVLISDTVNTIASALAALIPGATVLTNVITISGLFELNTAVATPYSSLEEIERQERVFMITCWSPTPGIRTLLGAAIKVYLTQQFRFALSDGDTAHMWYTHTNETDILEKSLVFRRDLNFNVQYATTIGGNNTTIVYPFANVSFDDEI